MDGEWGMANERKPELTAFRTPSFGFRPQTLFHFRRHSPLPIPHSPFDPLLASLGGAA